METLFSSMLSPSSDVNVSLSYTSTGRLIEHLLWVGLQSHHFAMIATIESSNHSTQDHHSRSSYQAINETNSKKSTIVADTPCAYLSLLVADLLCSPHDEHRIRQQNTRNMIILAFSNIERFAFLCMYRLFSFIICFLFYWFVHEVIFLAP